MGHNIMTATQTAHTDEQVAARALARRLAEKKVYGVPVATLRATEFAKLSPPNMPAKKLLSRRLDELTFPELSYIVEMAHIFAGNTGKKLTGIFNMNALSTYMHAKEIWGLIQQQVDPDRAQNGSFTITNPPQHQKDNANIVGRNAYKNVNSAAVVLDDRFGPERFLANTIGGQASPDEFKHLNLSKSAFHYLVLEHEYAHVSGAGEAQADMMAAARFMREFGTDDIPRAFADARVIYTMWVTINDMAARTKAQKSLLNRFNPLSILRRRKAAQTAKTYTWANVIAMDKIINEGIANARSLTDAEIHDMRFQNFEFDQSQVEKMVLLLNDQCLRQGIKTISMKNFADVANMMVMSMKLNPKIVTATPGMSEIKPYIERFSQAANRLYNRQTQQNLDLLKKTIDRSPHSPKR